MTAQMRIQIATKSDTTDDTSRVDGAPNLLVTVTALGTGTLRTLVIFDLYPYADALPSVTTVTPNSVWTFTLPNKYGVTVGLRMAVDAGTGIASSVDRIVAIPTQFALLVHPLYGERSNPLTTRQNVDGVRIAESTNNAASNPRGGEPRVNELIDKFEALYVSASAILPAVDTTAIVKGSADGSKLLRFEVDGLTTGTTRVITMTDADVSLVPNSGTYAAAAHASRHQNGGADEIAVAAAAANAIPKAGAGGKFAAGWIDDTAHGARGGGTQHADAIAGSTAGFMTGADKTKLDALVVTTARIEHRGEAPLTESNPVGFSRGACYREQVVDVDITVLNSTTYTITINGTACSYTSDGSATKTEIAAGLVIAINGNATTVLLVQAWYGTDEHVRIIDLDPTTATTITVGANLTKTTPVAQASYDYIDSGLGSAPAAGVTFWWDLRDAINAYWETEMGYAADYLPVGRYLFTGLVAFNGSAGPLSVANGTGLALRGGSVGVPYGYLALTLFGVATDFLPVTVVTNAYGMIRAWKQGATDQYMVSHGFGIYRQPY